MIPTLLWRCPLCHTDDALQHEGHWFRPDEVHCTRCGTVWEVHRVIGHDYLLRVIAGDSAHMGWQQPLAAWYDLMKAGLTLAPRPAPTLQLADGEEVYVQSRAAELLVEAQSPLRREWREGEAPTQRPGDIGLALMKRCDRGCLWLTNERLIWKGARGTLDFSLRRLNSVHTEVTWYLGLLYGLCLYKFRFREESILKWLTYIGLVAQRIERVYQHRIAVSNY
jgi:hypothetical protein